MKNAPMQKHKCYNLKIYFNL